MTELEDNKFLESIFEEADERARAEEAFLRAQLSKAYGTSTERKEDAK